MAKWNMFDVVNSVILKFPSVLKFPAVVFSWMSTLITIIITY